uniref:Uncharacterized protein n=1 Tax=Parastrongyloides trichosuri TaxID=131310 RepID=A0A0N5A064_PARTI
MLISKVKGTMNQISELRPSTKFIEMVPKFIKTDDVDSFIVKFRLAVKADKREINDPVVILILIIKLDEKVLTRLRKDLPDFEKMTSTAILLILQKWYTNEKYLENAILKLASFTIQIDNKNFREKLVKLKSIVDETHKISSTEQREITFKTELLRLTANRKYLRETISMNLQSTASDLIEELSHRAIAYHDFRHYYNENVHCL